MYLDVTFSLNRSLWFPLLTVMNSILQNTENSDAVRFNIAIPPETQAFFQEKISSVFPDGRVHVRLQEYLPPAYVRQYLDAKFREKSQERQYSRYMQYSRLFFKEIFPDLSRIVYLDGDIIVQGDIQNLFAQVPQFTPDHYLAAVSQFFPAFLYFSNPFKAIGEIRKFKKAFNSGVLLTDLTFWTDETYDRLKFYLALDQRHHYRLFNLGDETVMNLMFKEDYIPLDSQWNCCGYGNSQIVAFFLKKNPNQMQVIHWSGGHHKPWNSPNVVYADLWRKYCPTPDHSALTS